MGARDARHAPSARLCRACTPIKQFNRPLCRTPILYIHMRDLLAAYAASGLWWSANGRCASKGSGGGSGVKGVSGVSDDEGIECSTASSVSANNGANPPRRSNDATSSAREAELTFPSG